MQDAACVCGSGRKYKRCHGSAGDTLINPTVDTLLDWVEEELSDDLKLGLEEFSAAAGLETLGGRAELAGLEWVIHDRPLADGRTPAETFVDEAELSPAERERAEWLAASRLSLYRVCELQPGEWLELENVASGRRLHVVDPLLSRSAARGNARNGR